MSINNMYPKINTLKLDVYKRAIMHCDLDCDADLDVKGDSTMRNAHIYGDLVVEGGIIGKSDEVPVSAEYQRRTEAYQRRVKATQDQYTMNSPAAEHENNGDEELYPSRIANFHKGLQHDALGKVDLDAYDAFLAAVANPVLFDDVPNVGDRKWVNPLGGVAFSVEGADSHALVWPPAPTLASAEHASEMVEDYWMAMMRDVKFADYNTDATAVKAIADLNAMTDFRGPKIGGLVTPQTLFRGTTVGCLDGPYLSQFFYLDCPIGSSFISSKVRVPVAGDDFMTTWSEFLDIQNGVAPVATQTFEAERRYMITGRDLAEWVHVDALFQAYFQAGLILYSLGCPYNPGSPYLAGHQNQEGFVTFGPTYFLTLLGEVSNRALKAIWHKKWMVHRRVRPEAYAGLVDRHMNSLASYPLHADLLGSQALIDIHAANGSWLLPQAFPEGSPMHPSYGAGHATVAGACATALKAIFDTENFVIPSPVQPDATGENLVAYVGDPLTAAGEINKIAYNVTLGRDMAGVHWRSDDSLELGEAVTISILRDHKKMYHEAENFGGLTFKKFDGSNITV